MITCLALGKNRLGNQLFQFAALRAVGLCTGYEIRVPSSRDLRLSLFPNCEYRVLGPFDAKVLIHTYEQPGFGFDPEVFQIPDNTNLEGHFQSEKFFKDFELTIRHDFTFESQIITNARTILMRIDQSLDHLVSMHVRRGDYVAKPNTHPVLPLTYYKHAMSLFPADAKFILLSDDLEWCKQKFLESNIYFADPQNDAIDLAIMTLCGGNIIANSSYSWWGAWLNQFTRRVVAPKNWFGPKYQHLETSDLFPEDWITI